MSISDPLHWRSIRSMETFVGRWGRIKGPQHCHRYAFSYFGSIAPWISLSVAIRFCQKSQSFCHGRASRKFSTETIPLVTIFLQCEDRRSPTIFVCDDLYAVRSTGAARTTVRGAKKWFQIVFNLLCIIPAEWTSKGFGIGIGLCRGSGEHNSIIILNLRLCLCFLLLFLV